MFLGSANNDPRHWDSPERYDLARDPSGHVGFGMGLHQCVGQHVARLDAEALLTALARRVEHIELAGTRNATTTTPCAGGTPCPCACTWPVERRHRQPARRGDDMAYKWIAEEIERLVW